MNGLTIEDCFSLVLAGLQASHLESDKTERVLPRLLFLLPLSLCLLLYPELGAGLQLSKPASDRFNPLTVNS